LIDSSASSLAHSKREIEREKKLGMEELYSEEKLDRSSPVLWVS